MYFINTFSNYINDWKFIEHLTTAVDQFELLLPPTLLTYLLFTLVV